MVHTDDQNGFFYISWYEKLAHRKKQVNVNEIVVETNAYLPKTWNKIGETLVNGNRTQMRLCREI